MVAVRPMRSVDLHWVVPLEQKSFPSDPPWSLDLFRGELSRVPDTRWYGVAEDDDEQPWGYAGVRFPGYRGGVADLLTIAVDPTAQGTGIGSALLTAALDQGSARQARQMMLEVRVDNVRAIAFYQRHGFRPLATRRTYYADGTDAMIMRRPLERSPAGATHNQ